MESDSIKEILDDIKQVIQKYNIVHNDLSNINNKFISMKNQLKPEFMNNFTNILKYNKILAEVTKNSAEFFETFESATNIIEKSKNDVNLLAKKMNDHLILNKAEGIDINTHKKVIPINSEKFQNTLSLEKKLGFFRKSSIDEYNFCQRFSGNVWMAVKNNDICVLKKYDITKDKKNLHLLLNNSNKFHNFPNVLSINSIIRNNGIIYIEYPYYYDRNIMEWCEDPIKFKSEKIPRIFRQLATVMKTFHEFNVISNINVFSVLIQNKDICVCHLEKCIGDNYPHFDIKRNIYIAPEVKNTKDFTFQTDIYSLGITFLCIFKGIQIDSGKKIEELVSDIPENLANLIIKMTDANPKNRPDIQTILDDNFLQEKIECQICYKSAHTKYAITCTPIKDHHLCLKCFRKYITTSEFEYKKEGIKCPVEKCEFYFSLGRALKYSFKPEVDILYEKFKDAYIKEVMSHVQKNIGALSKEMFKKFNEHAESKLEYIKTGSAEHGQKILDYLLSERALEKNLGVKVCPNCNIIIYRIDGCDDMVCGRDADFKSPIYKGCGHFFSWHNAKWYKSVEKNIDSQIEKLSEELKRNKFLN